MNETFLIIRKIARSQDRNLWKISTSQGNDYINGCLLDYLYFKNYYKIVVIAFSKQQGLNADPKAIQQINFAGNLDQPGNKQCFSFLKKQKKPF